MTKAQRHKGAEESGKVSRAAGFFIILFCLLFLRNTDAGAKHPLDRFVIKEKDIAEFTLVRGPEYYGPGSLWNYINGGALPYLDYGVRDVITYAGVWKPDSLEIVVDVYDMADSLGAFGIYSNERSPEYEYLEAGIEGYITENSLCFWKGRYYVRVISGDDSPRTVSPLVEIAHAVDSLIRDSGGMPRYFSIFPQKGRLKRTEAYIAKNVLGQDYLSDAFVASYSSGKEEFQLYLIASENSQTAHEHFRAYSDFIREYGELKKEKLSTGDEAFIGKESWYGTVLFVRKGAFILGSVGLSDEKLARRHLETMAAGLP